MTKCMVRRAGGEGERAKFESGTGGGAGGRAGGRPGGGAAQRSAAGGRARGAQAGGAVARAGRIKTIHLSALSPQTDPQQVALSTGPWPYTTSPAPPYQSQRDLDDCRDSLPTFLTASHPLNYLAGEREGFSVPAQRRRAPLDDPEGLPSACADHAAHMLHVCGAHGGLVCAERAGRRPLCASRSVGRFGRQRSAALVASGLHGRAWHSGREAPVLSLPALLERKDNM